MTELERRDIKAKLIEFGFWGANEEGDPTADYRAVGLLLERIVKRFGTGFFVDADFAAEDLTTREVRVFGSEIDEPLAADEDLAVSICRAALALPDFLKQHPECAADQK